MIVWKSEPKTDDLSRYVDCYWFLERERDASTANFPKLYPDPSAHLIVAPLDEAYCYDAAGEVLRGKGSHWLFAHRQTYRMDHSRTSIVLGIKFRIGALYSLTSPHFQPQLDHVIDASLPLQFQSCKKSEAELLSQAQFDPDQCRDSLDGLLLPWIEKAKEDKRSALTRRAISLISTHSISTLGNKLDCTQRTLERHFLQVTGLTLKQCQSMRKLEGLLEHLYRQGEGEIDWAGIAFEFGFSDQPHLTRYLKAAIGETPGDYARLRDLTIDIYGGIDPH